MPPDPPPDPRPRSPRPPEPLLLVLESRGQWVLWSPRGSKGKQTIRGHWEKWPDAIRHALATARQCPHGAELILHPTPKTTRTLTFPPHPRQNHPLNPATNRIQNPPFPEKP